MPATHTHTNTLLFDTDQPVQQTHALHRATLGTATDHFPPSNAMLQQLCTSTRDPGSLRVMLPMTII